jgi:hypothetical protein
VYMKMVYYYSENPLFEIVKLIKNTKKKTPVNFLEKCYTIVCTYVLISS